VPFASFAVGYASAAVVLVSLQKFRLQEAMLVLAGMECRRQGLMTIWILLLMLGWPKLISGVIPTSSFLPRFDVRSFSCAVHRQPHPLPRSHSERSRSMIATSRSPPTSTHTSNAHKEGSLLQHATSFPRSSTLGNDDHD